MSSPALPSVHVAIIMDGNGRWATSRGWPRPVGHRAGAEAVRRVVAAASGLSIGTLTLYAFSSDNWHRPPREVRGLMDQFRSYLLAEGRTCAAHGIRLTVIGRRDRLPSSVRLAVDRAERDTAGGSNLHLRLAVDYSAREAIASAARRLAGGSDITPERFSRALSEESGRAQAPDVDLLIRTGGELRLSDFLLWECAYAELYFTPILWPDFSAGDLAESLRDFRSRARRFGRIPEAAAGR